MRPLTPYLKFDDPLFLKKSTTLFTVDSLIPIIGFLIKNLEK